MTARLRHVIMQAGNAADRDMSWWRWGNARYSPLKARQGSSDRLCGVRSSDYAMGIPQFHSYHSAFSSRQPRIVALPTERTNDSRLANSQWGANHSNHYSGEAVGPGQYNVSSGNRHPKPYKAILHGHVEQQLPASVARRKAIVQLVKKRVLLA